MKPELAPGFMVVHSDKTEALRDLLCLWLARHPLAPLEAETVLVPSTAIDQWLRMGIARDPFNGGLGICASVQTYLPLAFAWQAYRAVLGDDKVPPAGALDKSSLVWRLLRVIPTLLSDRRCATLRRFWEAHPDGRQRYQSAERIADLFDQYQVYRADWLTAWAAGSDTLPAHQGNTAAEVPAAQEWQPMLWRAILNDAGPQASAASRAEVHQAFLNAARRLSTRDRPSALPRRVIVFGVATLPQQALSVLAQLASVTQVMLFVHNPCAHDWSTLRRLGGKGLMASLHSTAIAQGHPLLAAWGQQTRDFIRMLDVHDERQLYEQHFAAIGQRIDLFSSSQAEHIRPSTMLRQLQDDILESRTPEQSRSRWPAVRAGQDSSVRFHVAHSLQRELEVLHDQLLAAFEADPTLQPREVVVMLPDVAASAPQIRAVFGQHDIDDPRRIPYTLMEAPATVQVLLNRTLVDLLGIAQSRMSLGEVLDWMQVPALARRFGFDVVDQSNLRRWLLAANIRWGLHAEQREALGLPAGYDMHSWAFGVRRMVLGYASDASEPWSGIEPMAEVGGLAAQALDPLLALLDALDGVWQTLRRPATPAAWGERLTALLGQFFAAESVEEQHWLDGVTNALRAWLTDCTAAGFDEELDLAVVRAHWQHLLDSATGAGGGSGVGGGVCFVGLSALRSVPFRWVGLLGMNDGDFPRAKAALEFDLIETQPRPGDRSRRDDDRSLFLQAVLSAREHLHISWVGRSAVDNSERAASVLVAQLADHISSVWRSSGDDRPQAQAGAALLAALTTTHRLQPFHPAYFAARNPQGSGHDPADTGLFTYASEWSAEAPRELTQQRDTHAALLPALGVQPSVAALAEFFAHPVRYFFNRRLQINLRVDEQTLDDHEPFGVDSLQQWRLQQELFDSAQSSELPRLEALAQSLDRMSARGDLPSGLSNIAARGQLLEPMQDWLTRFDQALAKWPHALPDRIVREWVPHSAGWEPGPEWGEVGGFRSNALGEMVRIIEEPRSLHSGSGKGTASLQGYKLFGHWLTHVLSRCGVDTASEANNGEFGESSHATWVIAKSGTVVLPPLGQEQARQLARAALEAWRLGNQHPLPLAPKTAWAWLKQGGSPAAGLLSGAGRAARQCYESDSQFSSGEARSDAALSRAFADFDALWAGGAFAHWVDVLYAPLFAALPQKKQGKRK